MDRGGNRGNRPQNLADHLLSSMPGVKHLAATVPGQQRRHPPLLPAGEHRCRSLLAGLISCGTGLVAYEYGSDQSLHPRRLGWT
jgi:hypothetical protein